MHGPVAPAVQQDPVVAHREEPGAVFAAVLLDGGDQRGRGGRVEHGGHLVAHQPARAQRQGPGEAGALELAVADLVGAAGQEVAGEADAAGEFGGAPGGLGAAPGGAQGFGDQVAQAQPGVGGGAGLLEDDADRGAQFARRPVAPAGHRPAVDGDTARVGAVQQGGDAGEGGLAAAAGAEQADRLAGGDGQRDVPEDGGAAVVPGGEGGEFKHGWPPRGRLRARRPRARRRFRARWCRTRGFRARGRTRRARGRRRAGRRPVPRGGRRRRR